MRIATTLAVLLFAVPAFADTCSPPTLTGAIRCTDDRGLTSTICVPTGTGGWRCSERS